MKVLGYLIGACLAMALVRAVVIALIVGLCVAVVVGACTRPRETFGLLAFVLIANLAEARPSACLAVFAILAFKMSVTGASRSS